MTLEPRISRDVIAAVQRLRLESATADVVRALGAHGIPCILLKGASIACWLYPDGPPRTFNDCDLLVSPADHLSATEVLAELGFEPHIDERAMPEWWIEHAMGWLRRQDGAAVDLHRTIPGVGVTPLRLWETLSSDLEKILVGGQPVHALALPGKAFHLALHAAQHGGQWGVKLDELRQAILQTNEHTWRSAARIAEQVGATPAFASGLRMVPEGRALAARFGLSMATPVAVALRAGTAPPVALGFDELARADGVLARIRILRHKLAPPPTFMLAWSHHAHRGLAGLMIAYVWRPVWLLLRAPAGFRAWRTARRDAGVAGSSDGRLRD